LPAQNRPYMLLRLAMAQHAAGQRPEAVETLEQAIDAANELGAGLIVRWADELSDQAGLANTRPSPAESELTAREQQVLDLITEGLSNGQIAERLYISVKTVSVHVSAILRKLGAASRTEAVRLSR